MQPFIAILAVLVLLTGCSSKNDVYIHESYNKMLKKHIEEQVVLGKAKATAIQKVFLFDCPPNEKGTESCGVMQALSAVLAADRIASIQTSEFKGTAPKTGIDAQIAGLNALGKGIPFGTMAIVSYKAIDKDKGSTTVSTSGEGNTVSISQDENHATAITTEGNPTATNSPGQSKLSKEEKEEEGEEEEGEKEEVTYPNSEWYSEGCSMSSHEEGRC